MVTNKTLNTVSGRRRRHKLILIAAVFFSMAFFFTGCEEELEESQVLTGVETPPSEPVYKTGSAKVKVDLNQDTGNKDLLQSALGTVSDVRLIKIVVKTADEKQEILSEATLQETFSGSKIWEGTVENIRLGVELQFEANAYNEAGEIIFTDTIVQTLSGVETEIVGVAVTFEMESVDDGIQPDNPKILSVSIPAEVTTGSVDTRISFRIEHSSVYEYRFEVEKGTLSTPMTGTQDPSTDLEIRYNAPSVAGEDTISIWVNDPAGTDSVGAIFPINVIDASVPVIIGVKFAPVITGLQFVRGSDFLMISASTDPETGLSFTWSGSGSFGGMPATGNPVLLGYYTDNFSGEITVTAEDDYGLKAELSRTIAVGDYPYVIVNPDPEPDPVPDPVPDPDPQIDLPDGTVLDSDTGLLWQDNGEQSRMQWADAVYFCENGLSLGDFSDWRLPTRKELKTAYKHRRMFSSYGKFGYWTSDLYNYDHYRAWSFRFSSGLDRLGKKRHKRVVRCVRTWE